MAAVEPTIIAPPHPPTVAGSRSERRRSLWSLNIIGIGVLFALCYYGELVLAVVLVSVLLAFILAPIVDFLAYLRLPRALGAFVALLLFFAVLAGIVYYSSNQAYTFLQDATRYRLSRQGKQ
jgi:predicted PurR-regulated permease PerM